MSSVRSNFADRHIGPDQHQLDFMLAELGEKKLADFIAKVVPENIALTEKLSSSLPKAVSEVEAIAELRQLADQNQVVKSLIGFGVFWHHYSAGNFTERFRKSCLVYGIYALSARNFTGQIGSNLCFSNSCNGFNRFRCFKCFYA